MLGEKGDRICREGATAWRRLQKGKTLDDWFKVGEALKVGRTWAMRQAKTNQPVGKAYNNAMGEFLERYGLLDMDKGDRSRLLDVMDNWTPIEEWMRRLPQNKRVKLNHPSGVLRAWKAAIEPEKPKQKPTMRDNLIELDEQNHLLQQENVGLRQQVQELQVARGASPQSLGEWVTSLRDKSREERAAAVRDLMRQLDLDAV